VIEFKLTQKQEAFCLAYPETTNASEAYRRAHDAANRLPATVNCRAVDLMDDAKIVARLDELRQPAIENEQITLESHLAKLAELRDTAANAQDWSTTIRAEVARGRTSAGRWGWKSKKCMSAPVLQADLSGEAACANRDCHARSASPHFDAASDDAKYTCR
jgi:phage terminase small subunit